jgi:hypothetical protein
VVRDRLGAVRDRLFGQKKGWVVGNRLGGQGQAELSRKGCVLGGQEQAGGQGQAGFLGRSWVVRDSATKDRLGGQGQCGQGQSCWSPTVWVVKG